MIRLEKDFQTAFNRWARYRWDGGSAAFELKLARGSSLPFNALAPHQKVSLKLSKHSILIYKAPDLGNLNPFDTFVMQEASAFIAVMFLPEQKVFYLIDIDVWCAEEETSSRKSLTEERAEQLGMLCVLGE